MAPVACIQTAFVGENHQKDGCDDCKQDDPHKTYTSTQPPLLPSPIPVERIDYVGVIRGLGLFLSTPVYHYDKNVLAYFDYCISLLECKQKC